MSENKHQVHADEVMQALYCASSRGYGAKSPPRLQDQSSYRTLFHQDDFIFFIRDMTTATMAAAATTDSIPHQMQAQQLHGYNEPYRLVDDAAVPVPTNPNDILLRVDAASYCHTDAVLAAGQMPRLPLSFPHVGSHEFAGTVVAHAANASLVRPFLILLRTIRTLG